MQTEADEAASEANNAEEKSKKFMLDAAQLADELRSEQETAQKLENEKRDQEAKVKDLHIQLDDAETSAIKWGKKMIQKMEARGRELEAELDSEQRRCGDAHKNLRKAERGVKEYTFRYKHSATNIPYHYN